MPGITALGFKIIAKANENRKVSTTRFLRDFGAAAPAPVLGNTLLQA